MHLTTTSSGIAATYFIPNTLPAEVQSKRPSVTGDWSSLIGIVTAICGNVIISFALNTQRYAHVRLEREALGQDPNPRHKVGENGDSNGTDDQLSKQRRIADEQSKRNAESEAQVEEHGEVYSHGWHESDPLLPKLDGKLREAQPSDDGADDEEDNEKVEEHKKKNYLRSPFWWVGILLMVVGEAGNFLAYGFAPASIVSPLGVVALISNCLIAPIMLKEEFRKRDFLGIIIAVGGAVTVVLSAKGSNPKLGPHQILDLIKRWEFETYLGITLVFIVIFMLLSNKYGDRTIVIDIGLVGLFGGYTALSTKGVASLLSYRLFQIFTFPIAYVLVFVLVITAILQVKYLNRALQHFSATVVIPTQFVVFTIFVVMGSAILYRDFEQTSAADVGKFVGGVIMTFLGVWIITSGRTDHQVGTSVRGNKGQEDEEQEIDMVDEEENSPSIAHAPAPSTPVQQKRVSLLNPSTPYTPDFSTPTPFASAKSRIDTGPTTEHTASKPPMQTLHSTPFLPSEGHAHVSSSSRQSDVFSTPPPRPQLQQQSSSQRHLGNSLPRDWFNRNSILPGPYTSPLSSGLSVIVADSRRRDEGRRMSMSRRRSTRSAPLRDQGGVSSLTDNPGGAVPNASAGTNAPAGAQSSIAQSSEVPAAESSGTFDDSVIENSTATRAVPATVAPSSEPLITDPPPSAVGGTSDVSNTMSTEASNQPDDLPRVEVFGRLLRSNSVEVSSRVVEGRATTNDQDTNAKGKQTD